MKILAQVKIVDGWLVQERPVRFLGHDLTVINKIDEWEDNRPFDIIKVRIGSPNRECLHVLSQDSNIHAYNRHSRRYVIDSVKTQKSLLETYQSTHEYKQIGYYFYRIPRSNSVYVSEKGSKKYVVLWILLSELLDTRNLIVSDIVTLDRLNYNLIKRRFSLYKKSENFKGI